MNKSTITVLVSKKEKERIETEAEYLGITEADYVHYAIARLLKVGMSKELWSEVSEILREKEV